MGWFPKTSPLREVVDQWTGLKPFLRAIFYHNYQTNHLKVCWAILYSQIMEFVVVVVIWFLFCK